MDAWRQGCSAPGGRVCDGGGRPQLCQWTCPLVRWHTAQRIKDAQARSYCALGISLMGLRITTIDEESIAQELCNVSTETGDDFRTSRLIGTNHCPVVFWVELRCQPGGIDQVAEHDGQLAAFGFGRGRGDWWRGDLGGLDFWRSFLRSKLGGSGCRLRFDFSSPDENATLLVRCQTLGVDQFFFEDIQILVIDVEAHLERAIGHTSLAFEEGDNLIKNIVQRHGRVTHPAVQPVRAFPGLQPIVGRSSVAPHLRQPLPSAR